MFKKILKIIFFSVAFFTLLILITSLTGGNNYFWYIFWLGIIIIILFFNKDILYNITTKMPKKRKNAVLTSCIFFSFLILARLFPSQTVNNTLNYFQALIWIVILCLIIFIIYQFWSKYWVRVLSISLIIPFLYVLGSWHDYAKTNQLTFLKRSFKNYNFCKQCEKSTPVLDCAILSFENTNYFMSGKKYLEDDIKFYLDYSCKNVGPESSCDIKGRRDNIIKSRETFFIDAYCGNLLNEGSSKSLGIPIITTSPTLLNALFYGQGIVIGFGNLIAIMFYMMPLAALYILIIIILLIVVIKKQKNNLK